MLDIHWTAAPDECESLAVSLRAVLAGVGAKHPYDQLVSLLGLGAATVAVPDQCPRWWATFARDAALPASAELLGLRLRGLHAPAATTGLEHSAEFLQHFRDSYVPLMRRALATEQPLLVWRGWPAPDDRAWGVVVETRGEELRGFAPGSEKPITLAGPGLQVYVVEEYRPPEPAQRAPAALFAHASRIAHDSWQGKLPTAGGVETGLKAFQAWRERVSQPHACTCGEPSCRCHAPLVRAIIAARQSFASWLRRIADELDPSQRSLATEWAAACRRIAGRLGEFSDEGALATPTARDKLVQAIDDVCRLETEIRARNASEGLAN